MSEAGACRRCFERELPGGATSPHTDRRRQQSVRRHTSSTRKSARARANALTHTKPRARAARARARTNAHKCTRTRMARAAALLRAAAAALRVRRRLICV